MSLKAVYRNYINRLKSKPQRIRVMKQLAGEWIEIFTKERKAVVAGKLTRDEKQAVLSYWKEQGYGKIPLYWHSKYKAYSGKLDVRYFPEYLYTTKLEPKMNKDAISTVLCDKNLIEFLYAKVLADHDWIQIPVTLGGCASGYFYDWNRQPVSKQQLLENLKNISTDCIIKPSVGESSGNGVRLLCLENGMDKKTGQSGLEIINEYGEDFIIQKRIQEYEDWSVLNPSSVNTLRLITYRINGEIHASNPIMRIGRNGSHLDNSHAGGLFLAVNQDGTLGEYAHACGSMNQYDKHPDSKIIFKNHKISHVDKVFEAARKLHTCLPSIGFVNWDFAVDQDENVVVIESNMCCGSVWLVQYAHGCGVFGEDTPEMIQEICSKTWMETNR